MKTCEENDEDDDVYVNNDDDDDSDVADDDDDEDVVVVGMISYLCDENVFIYASVVARDARPLSLALPRYLSPARAFKLVIFF